MIRASQTGFYNHPVLKTPNLDAMAEMEFDLTGSTQLHQSASTRASILTEEVMTNRCTDHGYALRNQENIGNGLQKQGMLQVILGNGI